MLIHRLTETETEDTDEMVLDVINNKLNIEMAQISIGRSYRLGKQKGPGQKPQAIIVKFTQYKDRHHIFRNKKLLKGTSYFCYRKPYTKKDGTPQESERTTWFCTCLDTRWEDNV